MYRLQREMAMPMRSSQEYIDMIRAHSTELQKQFGITSMRLFGSVARNEHHEGSNIDLFVTMLPKSYNYILQFNILRICWSAIIDMIQDHKNIRPFFREQIEYDGINIFSES